MESNLHDNSSDESKQLGVRNPVRRLLTQFQTKQIVKILRKQKVQLKKQQKMMEQGIDFKPKVQQTKSQFIIENLKDLKLGELAKDL